MLLLELRHQPAQLVRAIGFDEIGAVEQHLPRVTGELAVLRRVDDGIDRPVLEPRVDVLGELATEALRRRAPLALLAPLDEVRRAGRGAAGRDVGLHLGGLLVEQQLDRPLLATVEARERLLERSLVPGEHPPDARGVDEDGAEPERNDRPALGGALEHGLVGAGDLLETLEIVEERGQDVLAVLDAGTRLTSAASPACSIRSTWPPKPESPAGAGAAAQVTQ